MASVSRSAPSSQTRDVNILQGYQKHGGFEQMLALMETIKSFGSGFFVLLTTLNSSRAHHGPSVFSICLTGIESLR